MTIDMSCINANTLEVFFKNCEEVRMELEDTLDELYEDYNIILDEEPEDYSSREWKEWDAKETKRHREIDYTEELIEGLEDLLLYRKKDMIDLLEWLIQHKDIAEE